MFIQILNPNLEAQIGFDPHSITIFRLSWVGFIFSKPRPNLENGTGTILKPNLDHRSLKMG